MVLNDPLANTLSKIENAEKVSKKECIIFPINKVIKKVLDIFNKEGYLGTYDVIEDNKGDSLKIYLLGNINKCGAIKPRFSVTQDNYEKFEKRFLPSRKLGIIIVSTPQGVMTHKQAKEKGIGGKLLAYCY